MKYVDLFSGCGGLSLGVEAAGGELVLAVEKSDMAARTFYHNLLGDMSSDSRWERYLNSSLIDQIADRVVVDELANVLSDQAAMAFVSASKVDAVVGGPPCQGFSLAGRRNRDDLRNRLPWEYLDFVDATSPKAVVIENVVGMDHSFDKGVESSFKQLQRALELTGPGYVVQGIRANAMHYGAPQHRPRLLIIGVREDIAASSGLTTTSDTWRSGFLDEIDQDIPSLAPRPTVTRSELRKLSDAVGDLTFDPSLRRGASKYVGELNGHAWPVRRNGRTFPENHVPRNHREATKTRFRLYQFLADSGLNTRLLGQIAYLDGPNAQSLALAELTDVSLPAVAPDGTILAETLQELVALTTSLATKKHSQKVLCWDEPARTVVTLPDDYVHPSEPRIFTVREMARFQGFPDHFEFLGKETTGAHRRRLEVPQYSQVGNAVSPWLGAAIGSLLNSVIEESEHKSLMAS